MGAADQTPFVVRCEGPLVLSHAPQTRELLLEALDRNASVVFDASAADDLDVSFIQLLVAARKSAAASGKSFGIALADYGVPAERLKTSNVSALDLPPQVTLAAKPQASAQGATSTADTDPGIDPAAVATLIREIGAPAVRESLDTFFAEMSSRLDTLKALSPASDLAAIKRGTHLLRGSAATFGLRKLAERVSEFERTVTTLDGDVYAAVLGHMAESLDRARVALEATTANAA